MAEEDEVGGCWSGLWGGDGCEEKKSKPGEGCSDFSFGRGEVVGGVNKKGSSGEGLLFGKMGSLSLGWRLEKRKIKNPKGGGLRRLPLVRDGF